jgi:hypothetical protein
MMEENFFRRPAVAGVLAGFVEARLHTDGQRNIERILALRERLIGHAATPMYTVIDPKTGAQRATFEGPTFDDGVYIEFLRKGSPRVAAWELPGSAGR